MNVSHCVPDARYHTEAEIALVLSTVSLILSLWMLWPLVWVLFKRRRRVVDVIV